MSYACVDITGFGVPTSSTAGTGLFGNTAAQPAAGGLFGNAATGNKTLFGQPATSTATTGFGGFGATNPAASTSLFGTATNKPVSCPTCVMWLTAAIHCIVAIRLLVMKAVFD